MALLPINIPFPVWVAELRNTYPTQPIPELSNENNWKGWVNELLLSKAFDGDFIPHAYDFKNWVDWASQFTLSIGA